MTSNISISHQQVISFEPRPDRSTSMLQKSFDGYIIALSFDGEWTTFVENGCKNGGEIVLETLVADIYFGRCSEYSSLSCGTVISGDDYICTIPFLRRYDYQGQDKKINNGNMPPIYIPIKHDTLNKIEENRNGNDLVISVVICGKIALSLSNGSSNMNGDHFVSSEPLSFMIPQSAWADSLGKAGVSYIPSVENVFCMNDSSKIIIDNVKKAKTRYNNGDYSGCVSECRHILEKKKLVVTDTKKASDNQLMRFKRAFELIKNLTHLSHHEGEEDPKHEFTRLEARCILATSIAFAELITNGYFDKEEDTTEQQEGRSNE